MLGYYVLVQSAEDLRVLTGESQDHFPVMLEGLAEDILYNVVVFPLTGEGIVGTDVAFTQQSMATPDTPEPPSLTTSPGTTGTTVTIVTTGWPNDPVSCETVKYCPLQLVVLLPHPHLAGVDYLTWS